VDLCDEYFHAYDFQIYENFSYLYSWPNEISLAAVNSESNIRKYEASFLSILESEKKSFAIELEEIKSNFNLIKTYNDYSAIKECILNVQHLSDQFEMADARMKSFN
jgi:hypothetical protein